jgi:tripartite-type tricarboxylate transporter receptor subunit TctC
VPTFDSLGVKNFEDVFWYGVVAPPGLPPEIAERIQKILARACSPIPAAPGCAPRCRAVVSTPADFSATMARETKQWRELADRLGIKPE